MDEAHRPIGYGGTIIDERLRRMIPLHVGPATEPPKPAAKPCDDCKDTGIYVGFSDRRPCPTCRSS